MELGLPCGHPQACATERDGELECEWCEQVAMLNRHLADMRACIGKMAFKVQPGATLTVQTPDPVGMVENYGGTVKIESGATGLKP